MVPSVIEQPSVDLTLWRVVKIHGLYHLVGEPILTEEGKPRITSPIAEYNADTRTVITASGREYRLFDGAQISIDMLRCDFLRGYCLKYGLDVLDIEIAELDEVALALSVPANRLEA